METVHSSTGTYFSVNHSFRLVGVSFYLLETVFFYSEFFLLVETIIETCKVSV